MSYRSKWKIAPEQLPELFAGAQSIAKRFIITNFRKQGFQDGAVKPWKAKKKKDGRNILVGKSNPHMMQSFHFDNTNKTSVRITNSKKYSGIHNEGEKKMPQRRMIGPSKTLDKMIDTDIARRMKKVFKK